MSYDAELKAATAAALAAGAVQIDKRQHILRVDTKSDRSPVTEVDTMCETIIREMLTKQFPATDFWERKPAKKKGRADGHGLWTRSTGHGRTFEASPPSVC